MMPYVHLSEHLECTLVSCSFEINYETYLVLLLLWLLLSQAKLFLNDFVKFQAGWRLLLAQLLMGQRLNKMKYE